MRVARREGRRPCVARDTGARFTRYLPVRQPLACEAQKRLWIQTDDQVRDQHPLRCTWCGDAFCGGLPRRAATACVQTSKLPTPHVTRAGSNPVYLITLDVRTSRCISPVLRVRMVHARKRDLSPAPYEHTSTTVLARTRSCARTAACTRARAGGAIANCATPERVQAVFTGAVEAGATEFLLPEDTAAAWRKLASVDVFTIGVSDGVESSDEECGAAGGGTVQIHGPDGAPCATRWRVTCGEELDALQARCGAAVLRSGSETCRLRRPDGTSCALKASSVSYGRRSARVGF